MLPLTISSLQPVSSSWMFDTFFKIFHFCLPLISFFLTVGHNLDPCIFTFCYYLLLIARYKLFLIDKYYSKLDNSHLKRQCRFTFLTNMVVKSRILHSVCLIGTRFSLKQAANVLYLFFYLSAASYVHRSYS